MLEKRIKTLRFAMGTKVECKTGGGWVKGEVVAHMYRDEFMPLEAEYVSLYPKLKRTRMQPYSVAFRCIHCTRTPRLHAAL